MHHGPSLSPVQGRHQHHQLQQQQTSSARRNLNNAAPTEPGSPTTTIPQSPLRQSFCYDDNDDNEDALLAGPTFRGVIDFANSTIGRTAMSFTGDRRSRARKSGGNELQQDTMTATMDTPTPTPKNLSPPTVGSSRFAVFASTMFKGKTSTASSPVSVPRDDELMNLDIDAALFPAGPQGEAFSPAAFKNLQQTATGLLNRFQSAYQQRTIAYHELKAERGVQADEKEEVETRMQHLRMQLEDMARKAAEQEAAMLSLMDELAREKLLRQDERQEARDKPTSLSEGSSVSEDLGVEEDQCRRRRKWRRSGGTTRSDMGFDTDEESAEEASVFSRSRSPTNATILTDISPVEPPLPQIRTTPLIVAPRMPRPPPPTSSQQQQQQQQRQPQAQMNTFQKLFKGISGDASMDADSRSASSCRNCEGQDASIAWDTVNLLKDENKGLKERVGELETAVGGALDAVNGIGL